MIADKSVGLGSRRNPGAARPEAHETDRAIAPPYELRQKLAMLPQPCTRPFHPWRVGAHDAPESNRVVRLDRMRELMHDDVVDDEHRRLDQPPTEVDVAVRGTRAPAGTAVGDARSTVAHPEVPGVPLDSGQDAFLCPGDAPLAHRGPLATCERGGNEETLVEAGVTGAFLHQFDPVASARIPRRFAVDQLLAGRVGRLPVLAAAEAPPSPCPYSSRTP